MKPSIFVTRRLPDGAMEILERDFAVTCNPDNRILERDELLAGVRDKDALLCLLTDRVDGEVMDAGNQLKVISNYAVGFDNIVVDDATQRGLPVCNTPGVLTETTADLAFTLILGIARRVVEADVYTRTGQWKEWAPNVLLGNDVHGKTLGILGMGRIGQAVARRAQGFNMRILYAGPLTGEAVPGEHVSFDDLLAQSDFLSVHVPYSEETHHMIDAKALAKMPAHAFLINTARGPIVDEKALLDALRSRSIAGAGLDVFEHEPRVTPGLAELENAILLPHVGSATIETRTAMGVMAAENAYAVVTGKDPHSIVNPSVLQEQS